MPLCGPKLSMLCTVVSAWGLVQLGLTGVAFFVRSPALVEDIPIHELWVSSIHTVDILSSNSYCNKSKVCTRVWAQLSQGLVKAPCVQWAGPGAQPAGVDDGAAHRLPAVRPQLLDRRPALPGHPGLLRPPALGKSSEPGTVQGSQLCYLFSVLGFFSWDCSVRIPHHCTLHFTSGTIILLKILMKFDILIIQITFWILKRLLSTGLVLILPSFRLHSFE